MKNNLTLSALLTASLLAYIPSVSARDVDAWNFDHHNHHHEMHEASEPSTLNATLPNVQLLTQDGNKVMLQDVISDGRPLVLSFIFTSCQTVCPMTSQTLMQLQKKLGADADRVHILSISIDPEFDTPSRLKAYAAKYHAGAGWDHYTGTEDDSRKIQVAMGAYRADKMNHSPVYFISDGKSANWVRYEGLVSPDTLLHGLHGLMGAH